MKKVPQLELLFYSTIRYGAFFA